MVMTSSQWVLFKLIAHYVMTNEEKKEFLQTFKKLKTPIVITLALGS
jgi:hypothetical protein